MYVISNTGQPVYTRSDVVADYCQAAITAKQLLTDKVGMAGYRDMNLYGTLYDGLSLKKETDVEIETFLKRTNDDAMKKLCGFPPAPIFMLLSEDGYTTVSENYYISIETDAF